MHIIKYGFSPVNLSYINLICNSKNLVGWVGSLFLTVVHLLIVCFVGKSIGLDTHLENQILVERKRFKVLLNFPIGIKYHVP